MICLVKGTVKVYRNWIVAYIDEELIRYYRSLIPKAKYVNPPKTKAHATIVRAFERPDRFGWNKYDGEPIDILYYSGIQTDRRNLYYWLIADCDRIVKIRRELGLTDYIGLYENLHITVGNRK